MQKIKFLTILLCIFNSCKSEIKKHSLLISFEREIDDVQNLYELENNPNSQEIIVTDKQEEDTLLVQYQEIGGFFDQIDGNIEVKNDTINLKRYGKRGVREIVVKTYKYKILNKEKKNYAFKVENIEIVE